MNIEKIGEKFSRIINGFIGTVAIAFIFSIISNRIELGALVFLGFYWGYILSFTKDHMDSNTTLISSIIISAVLTFLTLIFSESTIPLMYILASCFLSALCSLITIFYLYDFEKMWKEMSERSKEKHFGSSCLNKKYLS